MFIVFGFTILSRASDAAYEGRKELNIRIKEFKLRVKMKSKHIVAVSHS